MVVCGMVQNGMSGYDAGCHDDRRRHHEIKDDMI